MWSKCNPQCNPRLRNEINRLLREGMSNIYLKVIVEEKNWRSQISIFKV